jgi:hypothetical protein
MPVVRRFALYAGLWLAGLLAYAVLAFVTSGDINRPARVRADVVADAAALAAHREERLEPREDSR